MLAMLSISHLSPGWDHFLQLAAIVIVFTMAELIVVELVAPQPAWPLHLILLAIIYVISIPLSLWLSVPATGRMADGLHWAAISGTLFLLTVLTAAAWLPDSDKWSTKGIITFYAVVLALDTAFVFVLWVLFA